MSETLIIERPGCAIRCWLYGPKGAPFLLFLHGATADHGMFMPQLTALESQYRIALMDIRGHGCSRPCEAFSVQDARGDVIALLDHLQESEVILIGQSMGGNIAQEVVFHHPDRVKALVMIGSTCNTMRLSFLEKWSVGLTPALLRRWPYQNLVDITAKSSGLLPETQSYVREAVSQLSLAEIGQIWEGLVRILHHEPGYRIEHPLLLMHGDRDNTGNIRKVAPKWAKRDPHCRYVVVPKASHVANMDQPEFTNRVLLEFLEGLEGE
jgi:pimeloyl-ACP methyl ester carboxylesterase